VNETASVQIEVLEIERVAGCGKLVAVANVLVAIHDIEVILQGCQIRVTEDGRYCAQAPRWRHPRNGVWYPCIVADKSLTAALGNELVAAMEATP
jgi:hypothetical protein